MTLKKQKPHHHGNLREALVKAGLELLDEGGPEALTLRKCAARAGVSHAAPAHHFDGLPGLKTAIAAHGQRIFARLMQEGVDAAGVDPRARAMGMALGYVKFATENPALFKLTFAPMSSFVEDKERFEAARISREILTDVCAPFTTNSEDALNTEVAVWSLTHGFVNLIDSGRVAPGSGDARDTKFEDIFGLLQLQVNEPDSNG